jgi:hypothetical protein
MEVLDPLAHLSPMVLIKLVSFGLLAVEAVAVITAQFPLEQEEAAPVFLPRGQELVKEEPRPQMVLMEVATLDLAEEEVVDKPDLLYLQAAETAALVL